jgi:hypothetical protein
MTARLHGPALARRGFVIVGERSLEDHNVAVFLTLQRLTHVKKNF